MGYVYSVQLGNPIKKLNEGRMNVSFQTVQEAMYEGYALIEQVEEQYKSAILWDEHLFIGGFKNSFQVLRGKMVGYGDEPFYLQITVEESIKSSPLFAKPMVPSAGINEAQQDFADNMADFFASLHTGKLKKIRVVVGTHVEEIDDDEFFQDIYEEEEDVEPLICSKEKARQMSLKELELEQPVIICEDYDEDGFPIFPHPFSYSIERTDDDILIHFELMENKKFWSHLFNLEFFIEQIAEVITAGEDFCLDDIDTDDPNGMLLQFHHHFNGRTMKTAIEKAERLLFDLQHQAISELITFAQDTWNKMEKPKKK